MLFDAFQVEQISIYAGIVFFSILYAPIELVLSIGLNYLSRKHEYEADAFAAETIASPETAYFRSENPICFQSWQFDTPSFDRLAQL